LHKKKGESLSDPQDNHLATITNTTNQQNKISKTTQIKKTSKSQKVKQ
jgi:hypothetical protein